MESWLAITEAAGSDPDAGLRAVAVTAQIVTYSGTHYRFCESGLPGRPLKRELPLADR